MVGADLVLHAAFSLRLDDFELAVDVVAPAGAVTAVLGPNGAGKTTLLRCVAGNCPIDDGTIQLDDVVLDAPPRTFVAPERRRLGVVHQRLLLFPHLSALDNVAFGVRAHGRDKTSARGVAIDLLERVGVSELADVKPNSLSGGQAQRVALARALATSPAALLLDEPLAALDATIRADVRRDLRRHLVEFGGPSLLVTHDPTDALALADHVVILENGRVTQGGTIGEVTSRPRTPYVADLIGTNLVHGVAQGTTITSDAGVLFITAEAHDGTVFATIAPSAVVLHRDEPEGSARNRWRATVTHLDRLGERIRVHLAAPLNLVAEVTPGAVEEMAVREGDAVWASVKATEIAAYPR